MLTSAFKRMGSQNTSNQEQQQIKVVQMEETNLARMPSFGNGSKDGVFVASYGKHSPNFKLNKGDQVDIDGAMYHMGQPLVGRKEDIMQLDNEFGTCKEEPSEQLRWGVDRTTAASIACFNKHYDTKAIKGIRGEGTVLPHTLYERSMMGTGVFPLHYWDKWHESLRYWEKNTAFITEEFVHNNKNEPVIFYDTATKKPLFVAPRGRSWDDFLQESKKNERLSFREEEIVQENVRELSDGAVVSIDGTHLGHIKPDKKGIRYGINIVSIAG